MNSSAIRQMLSRPIAFHRIFVSITGSLTAGLMLSQAYYWSDGRTTLKDGWFWKNQEEWEEETSLSRAEQETARKRLKELEILEEKKEGIPCRLYFRLNEARIEELILNPPEPKPKRVNVGKKKKSTEEQGATGKDAIEWQSTNSKGFGTSDESPQSVIEWQTGESLNDRQLCYSMADILCTENTSENTPETTALTFSNPPRAAETETPTSYNIEFNPPSIENPLKPNSTISVQAQQFPTAQPQAEVKPSQPAEAQNEADQLQLPLSQKKEKAEIVVLSQQSKESPPMRAATPPLSKGKGKQKKNMLSAEQEATFLAIYLEERASNMVKHQSLPEGAKKHLYDLTQKYPDNYYNVLRGGMQSLREREDGWWRDEKRSFTLVNLMTEGRFIGFYETHLLDMERNPNYVRRVQGLAPSKDKGRQQMSVLDEAGNPVSNELAQMVETVQSHDLVRRLSNLKERNPEWYR